MIDCITFTRYKITLLLLCLTLSPAFPQSVANLSLWYTEPADASVADNEDAWQDDPEWLRALPLGNGNLGAMMFGDPNNERFQLNEKTLWSGSHDDNDNPEAKLYLDEIRSLLFAGKFKEATELTNRTQV